MVHVFTQLNLKQGLKIFGNSGMKATKLEMQKMHDNMVFHPIKGKKLTKKQKRSTASTNFFETKTMRKNKRPLHRRRTKTNIRIKKNPT